MNGKYFTRLDIIVIIAIILIGCIHLPRPFHGDQALFITTASKINQGAVLYRDIWDVKPPGIYLFYLAAGRMFGFHEIGIHLFELLFMTCFSIVLIMTLKDYCRNRWAVSVLPLFTVGMYYAVLDFQNQTQVEALVGFPLFISLWCSHKFLLSYPNKKFWLIISGAAASIVLVFKLIFLPIILVAPEKRSKYQIMLDISCCLCYVICRFFDNNPLKPCKLSP